MTNQHDTEENTMTNPTLIEKFETTTSQLEDLKVERSKLGRELRSAGIEADEKLKADLSAAADVAQEALADLDRQIKAAEAHKAALDAAVDRGDDGVDNMELFSAGTDLRRLKGKRGGIDAEARRAKRAVVPFASDNHLALLVAETIEELVTVPCLVRARSADARAEGVTDAVVLVQPDSTADWGTARPSGRVQYTSIGSTGLDREVLEAALSDTGSEVTVQPGAIVFDRALWPKPRLFQPSPDDVSHFADVFAETLDAELKRPGRKAGKSYLHYNALWRTLKTDLEVVEPGVAKGRVVAFCGIEGARPPVEQMQHFINQTVAYFEMGVHTSAGMLGSINVIEIVDAGPWIDGDFMAHREYAARHRLEIELTYLYEPIEAA